MRIEISAKNRPLGTELIDWASWTWTPSGWTGVAELELDDILVEPRPDGELRWFLFQRPDGEHVLVYQFNDFVMVLLPWVVWEQLADGSWYKHCCRTVDEAASIYESLIEAGVSAIFNNAQKLRIA